MVAAQQAEELGHRDLWFEEQLPILDWTSVLGPRSFGKRLR